MAKEKKREVVTTVTITLTDQEQADLFALKSEWRESSSGEVFRRLLKERMTRIIENEN